MTLTTVAVVGLGSMFVNNTVQAETSKNLSEIHNERESIKANLSDAEAKIADVMIDLEELNEKVKRVDKALKANQTKMDETKGKIKDTQEEVKALEEEIKKLEKEIESRYKILKERIVSYQQSGGNIGYMDVIFGSKSFGEFIGRVSAVNKITNSDAELMEEQEKAKKDLEDKQAKIEDKLDDLKDMETELKGMEANILKQKEQNEKDKKELKSKQEKLQEQINKLEIKDSNLAEIESEVSQSIAQTRINRNPASTQTDRSSNLTTLSGKKSSNNSSSSKTTVSSSGGGGLSTAINAGYPHIGTPYVWNGESPSGFDCSGFVSWAFAQGGISVPSSTSGLQGIGHQVSYSNIQPGDLVFFNTYKTNGHVGIYVGGGNFIGAQSSTGLAVANMTSGYWANHFAGHVRRVR